MSDERRDTYYSIRSNNSYNHGKLFRIFEYKFILNKMVKNSDYL